MCIIWVMSGGWGLETGDWRLETHQLKTTTPAGVTPNQAKQENLYAGHIK